MNVICRHCGHRWDYTGKAVNPTCPSCGYKTSIEPPTLAEYHMNHNLQVVSLGGKSYVKVPAGDDLWGNIDVVKKCATVMSWPVLEDESQILVPTYAYDRVVVASLWCSV
jgi:hypothetical protein